MLNLLITSLCVLSLCSVFAIEWPYARLQKLYQKDADLCVSTAKRYIKYFPERAPSYYFVVRVNLDRSTSAKNPKSAYNSLNTAIRYANQFESHAEIALREEMKWDAVVEQLKVNFEKFAEMKANGEHRELTHKLLKQLQDLADLEDYVLPEKEIVSNNKQESSPQKTVVNVSDGQLYGVPNGKENIPSFNVSMEKEMLIRINRERRKLKMDTLIWNEDLARASRYHAFDLGTQAYFDHNSYDRSGDELTKVCATFSRIKQFYTASFVNAENIAAGNQTVENTYLQWYHSEGHYKNMFNKASRKAGVGLAYIPGSPYGYYWVFVSAL